MLWNLQRLGKRDLAFAFFQDTVDTSNDVQQIWTALPRCTNRLFHIKHDILRNSHTQDGILHCGVSDDVHTFFRNLSYGVFYICQQVSGKYNTSGSRAHLSALCLEISSGKMFFFSDSLRCNLLQRLKYYFKIFCLFLANNMEY